jgi:hypothetical protein
MKPQQLISAGFAIAAIAAASVPALGWTLLGDVFDPRVASGTSPASEVAPLFGPESIHAVTVALKLPDVLERGETSSP